MERFLLNGTSVVCRDNYDQRDKKLDGTESPQNMLHNNKNN